MSQYTLHLKNINNSGLDLPLEIKKDDDILYDYQEKVSDIYIHNDHQYTISVTNESYEMIPIEYLFVNNEIVDDRNFLKGLKPSFLFLECFGIVKLEVIVEGRSYITQNLKIIMREESFSKELRNMIDYIYDNCDNYLYEEHKYSKTSVGINQNNNVSIDSKLSLLNNIYDVYIKSYNFLKFSAQRKLINVDKIGTFNDLQSIKPDTIRYIANHPEELQPVNYNSGIILNKQYYQPQKTLINSISYSSDIYENQIIVGFLKTIVNDLKNIKSTIEMHRQQLKKPYSKDGYIDSTYYIFTRNNKMLDEYLESIDQSVQKFQKMFLEYKNILKVKDVTVIGVPNFTNIFRKLNPYNTIYQEISKWFNCGNYDMTKSELLLSFITVSKIYEYYCLLKINKSIENCGYASLSSYSFKYEENKYYKNTNYNNTFVFAKEDYKLTLYFQPVINGENRKKTNAINLFRNTKISITYPHEYKNFIETKDPKHATWYTPDYLIKISHNNITNYYILDAKYSHPNKVVSLQLPYLVYKYLFSISSISNGESVSGLCLLCGKTQQNSYENIYDIAEKMKVTISPKAIVCSLTGTHTEDNTSLISYINEIEKSL